MGVSSESLSGKHTLSWKGTHASFLGSKYFGADVAIKKAAPGDSYFKQRIMLYANEVARVALLDE